MEFLIIKYKKIKSYRFTHIRWKVQIYISDTTQGDNSFSFHLQNIHS